MATQMKMSARHVQPTYGRRRRLTASELSARVERMYVACVAVALSAAGAAIGFTFGVVPYFREALDFSKYDGFFGWSVLIGALVGLTVGMANARKWYRAAEASPLLQRRMLAYLQRRGSNERGVSVRSMNVISLRSLMGARRGSQA
jgi:hypothetical protein